jgi:hypothetical protein
MDTLPDAFPSSTQAKFTAPFPPGAPGASSQGLPGVSETPETPARIKVHGTSILLRGSQPTRR